MDYLPTMPHMTERKKNILRTKLDCMSNGNRIAPDWLWNKIYVMSS